MIELGLGWRIRDGKSVHIPKDRWLPKTPAARIVSPIGVLPQECKVSELIDEGTHT